MTYVLILTVAFYQGGAITTAEFNTKAACEAAARAWVARFDTGLRTAVAQCFEKGLPQ